MTDVKKYFEEALQDPEIRAEVEAMEPIYAIKRQLLAARLELNLTQAELAERIGTKQSSIARAESGRSLPSLRFMQKMARALGKKLTITFS